MSMDRNLARGADRAGALRAACGAFATVLMLAGCGGGGDGGGGDQVEKLTIGSPSNTGQYSTDQAFVTLTGTAFKPAYVDGPTPVWMQCGLTDRYGVTAIDDAGGVPGTPIVGEAAWIGGGPSCAGLDVYIRFIDLPLQPGTNRITVTAREVNRVGTAVIVIERVPDRTPPGPLITWPSDGAVGVPLTTSAGAEFSEPIDPASVRVDTVVLHELATGAAVPGHPTYFRPTRRVEFMPAAALKPATVYRIDLRGITDASGNTPSPAIAWSFTTAP